MMLQVFAYIQTLKIIQTAHVNVYISCTPIKLPKKDVIWKHIVTKFCLLKFYNQSNNIYMLNMV